MSWFSNPISTIGNVWQSTLPIAGAGVGGFVGGPAGAALGYLIGNQFNADRNNQMNFQLQEKQFNQNLAFQKEQYEYAKNLQREVFAREDNATQRRAADLQASGLSKTLAVGSGAGVGSVVPTSAPQGQAPRRELNQILAQNAVALAMADKELDVKDATIANLAKQNSNLDIQGDLLRAQKRAANAGAALDEHDLEFLKDKNMWRGSSSGIRTITDTEEQLKRASRQVDKANYDKNPVKVLRKGKWHTLSYEEWLKIIND